MKLIILFTIFYFINIHTSFSGCNPTSPGATACSNCNAASGDVLTTTKCYSGSGTFASYTINAGGLLRVCGSLTITSLSLGTGTSGNTTQIVVESGGSLTINGINSGAALNDYTTIYNRGTMTINANITIGSSNTFIVTDIPSATTTYNNPVNLSTGTIVNRGNSIFNSTVTFNGTATYCAEKSLTEWNYVPAWSATLAGNSIQYGGSGTDDAIINFKGTNSISANAFGLSSSNQIKLCRNGSGDNPPVNYSPASYSSSSCATPLPLIITKLKTDIQNDGIKLTWTTSTEINNEYFEIEKSVDGINFEKIGQTNGAGNKYTETTYNFFDYNSNINLTNYYRLKYFSSNGKFEYSSIFISNPSNSTSEFKLFPIPFEEGKILYIRFENNNVSYAKVSLFELSGKTIFTRNIENIKIYDTLEIANENSTLNKGSYIIEIKTESNTYHQKLIIN